MRDIFVAKVKKYLTEVPNSFFLTADLGFGVFDDFPTLYPKQFFNVGVAEQLLSSISCGLSLSGDKVFTYSIGIFPTVRCLEQIRNDICYHNSNVLITTSGAGFSYGSLGISHHCTEDISMLRCIPNLTICSPASEQEAAICIDRILNINTPCYLRLDKLNAKSFISEEKSLYGPFIHKSSKENKFLLLAHGSTVQIYNETLELYPEIEEKVTIATVPFLHQNEQLHDLLSSYKNIITVEEHQLAGGFGSFINEQMNICESKAKLRRFGLNHFSDIVGSQSYLRNLYLPNPSDIFEIIKTTR